MNVDIIVPVYNEQEILTATIRKLVDTFKPEQEFIYRIIIADNGSTDNTLKIAKELAKRFSNVKYLHTPIKGRGYVLRLGWSKSNADILCYIDADLSTNPQYLKEMIKKMVNEGFEIATCSKHLKNSKTTRSLIRKILSLGYCFIVRTMFNSKISDFQGGCKAITKSTIKKLLPLVRDNNWFFDTELLILGEKLNHKILEYPIICIDKRRGKVKILSTIYTFIIKIIELKVRLTKLS